MYESHRIRYIIGAVAVIVLVIIILALIAPGGSKPKSTNSAPQPLPSYATTDASVSMTIDGPEVSDQSHQAIKVIVDNSTATFEILQGYQGSVSTLDTFPNNVDSYTTFLYALERTAGFTLGNKSTALENQTGYCATGDRYIFDLTENGQNIEHYWATSCGAAVGTYLGAPNVTLTLFQDQIPGYSTLANNVNI